MAHESANSCFILTSYHQGYPWEDENVSAAKKVLDGHCKVQQFAMDTKRNPDEKFKLSQGEKACNLIKESKPDVVLALDDNASKYVVEPCLKDSNIKVVFMGVNWSEKAYGYPYTNATGMIEVQPIGFLLDEIKRTLPHAKRGLKIVQNRLSEQRNGERYKSIAKYKELDLEVVTYGSGDEFSQRYLQGQRYDFIILGDASDVKGLDAARLKSIVEQGKVLSASTSDWMIPYVMLTISQDKQEQGRYAAQVAVELLNGAQISNFPVIVNREIVVRINKALLDLAQIKLRAEFVRQALGE